MTSMNMTFLDQQNMLSRLLGDSNTSTDDMWPLADRKFELNRGEIELAREGKALLGYTTGTVSSQTISLPSDWLEIYALTVTEGGADKNIDNKFEISIKEIDLYDGTGDDFYYYWVDSSGTRQLSFVSSNSDNKTYKMWYFRRPTTVLDGDSDVSVHLDEYRKASVYYAASELLEQVGRTDMANRYLSKFLDISTKYRIETEKDYVNKQLAVPDIVDDYPYDADIQGRGQVNGCGPY